MVIWVNMQILFLWWCVAIRITITAVLNLNFEHTGSVQKISGNSRNLFLISKYVLMEPA